MEEKWREFVTKLRVILFPENILSMSGVVGRLGKIWRDYNVAIVMGGIITGGHLGWRWLQDQEAFVPAGQQKEYPWIEIARHVRNHEKQKASEDSDWAESDWVEKSSLKWSFLYHAIYYVCIILTSHENIHSDSKYRNFSFIKKLPKFYRIVINHPNSSVEG